MYPTYSFRPDGTHSVCSYDYIRDRYGDVYVVRGVVHGTREIVVRPIHVSVATSREKYNPSVPAHRQRIPHPLYSWGDPDNYIIASDDIQAIFPRNSVPCCEYPEECELIHDVLQAISCHNTATYLFGSRRLNLAGPTSDFDIIVAGGGCGRQLVATVVNSLGTKARLFNMAECLERAGRYGSPHGYVTKDVLAKLFQRSTCYMKTPIGEIGVFFTADNDTVIPEVAAKNKLPYRLRGRIVRSNGSSHLMPRTFTIECADGSLKRIGTILWGLGGIEECAGEEISLAGLYMVSEESYWLGGVATSLEFI